MRPDIAAITERMQVKLQIAIEHHHDMTRCEDEQALLAYIAELEEELAQARNALANAHQEENQGGAT